MIDLGPHAGFIIAAYGFTGMALSGLLVWIIADLRAQTRLVARLEEERGSLTRKSPAETTQ